MVFFQGSENCFPGIYVQKKSFLAALNMQISVSPTSSCLIHGLYIIKMPENLKWLSSKSLIYIKCCMDHQFRIESSLKLWFEQPCQQFYRCLFYNGGLGKKSVLSHNGIFNFNTSHWAKVDVELMGLTISWIRPRLHVFRENAKH